MMKELGFTHEIMQESLVSGHGSLTLATDPKPRLRWTADLHRRFVNAVAHLGGPESKSYSFS